MKLYTTKQCISKITLPILSHTYELFCNSLNTIRSLTLMVIALLAVSHFSMGQGVSIHKKNGPSAISTILDIDSITYSTDVAPTMTVHQKKNGFMCDLANIDSIKFGTNAEWEMTASGNFSYQILKSRAANICLSLICWGPSWKWMDMSGTESVSATNVRTITGVNAISNSPAKLTMNHTAFLNALREFTLTFDCSVDSSVSGAYIVAALTLDAGAYGKGSVQGFAKGKVAATIGTAFPLGAGGLDGDFDSLRLISDGHDTTMVVFDRLVNIASDNGARVRLMGDATKGTIYKTKITFRFPGNARFYPKASEGFQQGDLATWFPYSVGESGTPVDLSFLNKDAQGNYIPAGSHGFCKAAGDSFVFEDGTPARFWGVNVTAYGPKGSDARSVQIAERLARLGVNVARLHHLDSWWAPSNIDKNHPDGTTQHLDSLNIHKLDKCIYELKQRGIYVVLDPWVGREFREKDSVPLWGEMTGNFGQHPYVYYDKRLQYLLKLYWQQVWTHVNPYTGKTYADEPAIILTETINEGLFEGTEKEPYKTEFIAAYTDWARKNNADTALGEGINKNYGTDNINFYYYCTNNFYTTMREYLRSIGVKVPINGTNWSFWNWDVASQISMDYMDIHHYYGGDVVGAGNDLGGVWTEHSIYTFGGPWAHIAKHSIYGKPLAISECGQNPPKIYRGAYYPSFAAIACFQGWDCITGYAYTQGDEPGTKLDTYGWESDPATIAGLAAGALIYRRRDVQPARKTIIMHIPKSDFYILNWENGGERSTDNLPQFVASIETHKIVSVYGDTLPKGVNQADIVSVASAFAYKHPSTELKSDNDELWRDWARGVGTINTPRTQSAFGRFSGTTLTTTDCSFSIDNPYASVTITSLTNTPIATSAKILIVAAGRARNTGMAYSMLETAVTVEGDAPVMAEPVIGAVSFKTDKTAPKLYPINADGTKGAAVDVPVINGSAIVALKASYKTVFYEVD
jgi:hypothetical protein